MGWKEVSDSLAVHAYWMTECFLLFREFVACEKCLIKEEEIVGPAYSCNFLLFPSIFFPFFSLWKGQQYCPYQYITTS